MKQEKGVHERLLAAQLEIQAIRKDKKNPYFNSNYADINDVLAAVKPVLNRHGFVITQPLKASENGKNMLATSIFDAETGEDVLVSTMYLPDIDDAQKMGGAITYFRRYALQSLLSLEAEDDDGNSARPVSRPVDTHYEAPAEETDVQGEFERECPECGGQMAYKEGTTKTGKPYKGYFCITDRSHKPVWL